jgi:hypothetical protein
LKGEAIVRYEGVIEFNVGRQVDQMNCNTNVRRSVWLYAKENYRT